MDSIKKGAVCAIIVAAGKGTRMGLGFNKVLAAISGVPIIIRTIEAFSGSGLVGEIILVINPEEEAAVLKLLQEYRIDSEVLLVHGGSDRQKSVYNGLRSVSGKVEIVLIHDGARPLLDKHIIERSIESASKYGAACAGMPVKDTIKRVDNKGTIIESPERNSLWMAQTPQAFKVEIIKKAHELAIKNSIIGTDDAMLVEKTGSSVRMFEGSYRNIKVTSKEDLKLAESLIGFLDEAFDS